LPEQSPDELTILFIPLSAISHKLEIGWAENCDRIIVRRCPVRERDRSSATVAAASRRRMNAMFERRNT
jgi:hypothetical protein